MEKIEIRNKLIEMRSKLAKARLGSLPEEEIEQDIYIELDLTDAGIAGLLSHVEDKEEVDWNLVPFEQGVVRLEKYINELGGRGELRRRNPLLYELYNLCVEAIDLMKKYLIEIKNEK